MDNVFNVMIYGTGLTLWGLCAISFFGSFIAAALGLGGGVLVLVTMAQLLPPTVLVPIHGVVQLGSDLGRAILMVRGAMLSIVPSFFLGTRAGAALGAQIVVSLPTQLLQVVLAVFIVYATWVPKFRSSRPGQVKFLVVGIISTVVTMFVRVTGALVAPFVLAACADPREMVSTHAIVVSIHTVLK